MRRFFRPPRHPQVDAPEDDDLGKVVERGEDYLVVERRVTERIPIDTEDLPPVVDLPDESGIVEHDEPEDGHSSCDALFVHACLVLFCVSRILFIVPPGSPIRAHRGAFGRDQLPVQIG